MQIFKLLSVVLAVALLGACKIEVQVPEKGGSVRSENYTIGPGENYVVDVPDTTFQQTFVAEPAPGYEFIGWRRADGHFCGNSLQPCALRTTNGFEDGIFAQILASDRIFYLAPQFACAVDGSGQRPDTCDTITRTISGQVTDSPVPGAQVTVTLGGESFTTTADDQGFYSLEVISSQLDALVKIAASGISQTGQPLEFVFLPGSFENLDSATEQDVTNVTTAAYLLTVSANGGSEPATLDELRDAESSVDASAVLELAAVIKLIVDNPDYSVPEGFDSLLAFAADDDAVAGFIAEVEAGDGTAIDDTEDEIVNDDSLVEGFVAADLPVRYFEVATANPGYLARQGSILEFDTGNRFAFSYTFDASFRGTAGHVLEGVVEGELQEDGDTIVITDIVSASLAGTPYSISSPGIRAAQAGSEPVMSLSGDTLDFWVCTQGFTLTDENGNGDCPFGTEGGFLVSTEIEFVDETGGEALAGSPALVEQFSDERYRDWDTSVVGSNWSAQPQVAVNSGTGTVLGYDDVSGNPINQAFTWMIQGGDLIIEYDQPTVTVSFPVLSLEIATAEQLQILNEADPSLFQVEQNIATTRTVYRRVTRGALVDLVSYTQEVEISYPPITAGDQVVQLASSSDTIDGTTSFRSDNNIEITPFAATCGGNNGAVCVPGTWGASFRYSPGTGFGGEYPVSDWADVVTFNTDGTASGQLAGAAASWSVTDGSLVIDYSDGWTQTVTIVDKAGIEYGVLKEFSNGSERFADYSFYVKAGTPLVFSESFLVNAAGEYWSGEINNWIPGALESNGQPTPINTFGWSFGAGGAGFLEFAIEPGPEIIQSPTTWLVEDNVLSIDRGSDVIRQWYPVSSTVVGESRQIYVLERQLHGGILGIPPRINIKRERPRRADYVNEPVQP